MGHSMHTRQLFSAVVAFAVLAILRASGQVPDAPAASVEITSNPASFVQGENPCTSGPAGLLPLDSDPCRAYQFWGTGEYLFWWMKPVCQKRPLLNSGSEADPVLGAAGQPGTRPILGTSKYEMPPASGVRGTIGLWLTDCSELGWEASGFWLEEVENTHAFRSQDGGPASFIPFDDQNNVSQALRFSVPGLVDGGIVATGSSELWGAETNIIWRFLECGGPWCRRVSVLGGFRVVNLRDEIAIVQTQTLIADPSSIATGASNYVTENRFYGAQIGVRFELSHGRWGIEATGKFAPGETNLVSEITGNPLVAGAQVLAGSVPGPLLAFPSNVSTRETWALSFAQELTVRLRCQLASNVSASLGYNLLYLNRIACPGDQMAPMVNVTQLPQFAPLTGKVEPKPLLFHTDYFAQGLTAGVEVRY